MSFQIGPVGASYFSLEAFRNSRETSPISLMERALLSLQKQYSFAISSHAIPQGQAFLVPKEWVESIVSRLRTPFGSSEGNSLQQDNIKALEVFLLELRDPENSIDTLQAQFNSLGEPMRTILCRWIWHADKEPQGDPQYGERRIQTDPRYLLSFTDENGNNIVERLIELASIAPLNAVIEQCSRETFRFAEVILLGKSCKEALLIAVAQPFAETFIRDLNPDKRTELLSQIASMDDPYLRYEIAKLCAQQNAWKAIRYIQNFGLINQDWLCDIAKLCAQQNAEGTAKNIESFGIVKEADRFKIAKLCSRRSGGGTAENIERFGIEKEADRYEIAKLCAKQNAWKTIGHIQNFGLINQGWLLDIAKLCAQQNAEGTAENIERFGIIKEADRFEIAKLCAQRNGGGTAENIEQFGIKKEADRYEIAKLCAQQDGEMTAVYIWKFGLINQDWLCDIAKLCAQQNGGGTAWSIQKFKIKKEADRFEIAKLCAWHNLDMTAECMQDFRITEDHQARVKNLCVWSKASSLELSDSDKEHFRTKIFPFVREKLSSEYRFFMEAFPAPQGDQEGRIHQRKDRDIIENHPENISELSSQAIAKLSAIQYILDECADEPIPEAIRAACIEILTYRNLSISFSCLLGLSSYMQNPKAIETYKNLISTIRRPSGIVHLLLPMLMVAKWKTACADPAEIENACEGIKQCIIRQKSPFKNAHSGLMQIWLLTCLALEMQIELAAEEKIQLLYKATSALNPEDPSKELKRRLSCLQSLVIMQEETLRKTAKEPIENLTEHLSDLITEALSRDPYLGLEEIDNLTDKYLSTLAIMRVPNAWITYAARVKQTGDADVEKAFQHALINILNRTHREFRYADESSPHIAQIVRTHKEVWDQWKLPHEGQLMSLDLKGQKPFFSFQEYLKTKSGDGHLRKADGTTLGFLAAVIEAFPEAEAKQIECQEMAAKSDDPLLQAQDLLIGLYLGKGSKIEILEKKEELQKAIAALRDYEIGNDLRGLLEGLAKSQELRQKVLVIDTDDWQDLLLCGTEVAGSCQRVDGDPHLNPCLLAYVIDGKNRMLAIKDSSGKIQARALFRMLWDPARQEPVLFLDRIYPSPCPPAYTEALNDLAKERARSLGLRLYVQGMGTGVLIESLGSRAPWEYEDASEGVQKNGVFTIKNAKEFLI